MLACPSKQQVIHRHHTPGTSARRRRKLPSTSTGQAPLGHDRVVQRLQTGDVDPREGGERLDDLAQRDEREVALDGMACLAIHPLRDLGGRRR